MIKICRLVLKMFPQSDGDSAVSREIADLKAALVRYRETDEKRRAIHRKLKRRLQEQKAVVKAARRELREREKAQVRVEAELEIARNILE